MQQAIAEYYAALNLYACRRVITVSLETVRLVGQLRPASSLPDSFSPLTAEKLKNSTND